MESHRNWSMIKHFSKWPQMCPHTHIKSYFDIYLAHEVDQNSKIVEWEASLNIAQHGSNVPYQTYQVILWSISAKKLTKLKNQKGEAGWNISQNGFKCPLIVISINILVHFRQKRGKNWGAISPLQPPLCDIKFFKNIFFWGGGHLGSWQQKSYGIKYI